MIHAKNLENNRNTKAGAKIAGTQARVRGPAFACNRRQLDKTSNKFCREKLKPNFVKLH